MKIFISIASYQDPLLETTIYSAFDGAENPENLYFGVCDQSSHPLSTESFPHNLNISYEHVNPKDSEGPCWARHRIQKFFNNEDYYLQIDSHMQFQEGWDAYLLSYIKKIESESKSCHKLPIISCYPRAFDILDFESKDFKLLDEDKNTHTIAYREDSLFLKDSFSRQIGAITETEITHGYLLAAGCLFAPGSFVTEVPYDPEFYFYGEEISLMLRAFTRGFGIFHIPAVPIFHLYTDTSDIKRKLHWDEEEDTGREIKWHEREEKSLNKLSELIDGRIDGIYGLGTKRDLSDYEFLSGVDLKNKLVSDKTKAISAEFISTLSWKDSPF